MSRRTKAAKCEWEAIRQLVLKRDMNCCQGTGAVHDSQLHVHHRLPRSMGGQDDPANLVTLCSACHAGLHLNLQVGLGKNSIRKWAVRIAKLVDRNGEIPKNVGELLPALSVLGKSEFRRGQLPVVLAILRGEDVLSVRPTGSGKSLCFQVPVLLKPGTGLVIEPLKALMKDQVRALHDLAIPATSISSDVGIQERKERYELLEEGVWKFLFMAPERFNPSIVQNSAEQEQLSKFRPNFLVIDEAHSIVQYGRSFRPTYANLGAIRERVGKPQVLAFTATADFPAQQEICKSLGIADANIIVENPDRANIALLRVPMGSEDQRRYAVTQKLLYRYRDEKTIIFVPTKRIGEEVQKNLAELGIALEFFHATAGSSNWRDNVQRRFIGGIDPPVNAIIATSAFGMGIDVPNIRCVIHWQYPFSISEYVQGFGRAGRDGKESVAVLFVDGSRELELLNWMQERQNPSGVPPAQAKQLREMDFVAKDPATCFRESLMTPLRVTKPKKRSVAMWLLEKALAQKEVKNRSHLCCDVCNPKVVAQLLRNDLDGQTNRQLETRVFRSVAAANLEIKEVALIPSLQEIEEAADLIELLRNENRNDGSGDDLGTVDSSGFLDTEQLPVEADLRFDVETTVNQKTKERWPERFAKSQRAYSAWTDEEDLHLLRLRDLGKSVNQIAKLHYRAPGAIRSRLEKLEETAGANDEVVRGTDEVDGSKLQSEIVVSDLKKLRYDKPSSLSAKRRSRWPELYEVHPRAYSSWTSEEDDHLRDLHALGLELRMIAELHGRDIGGVQSRLGKLGLR